MAQDLPQTRMPIVGSAVDIISAFFFFFFFFFCRCVKIGRHTYTLQKKFPQNVQLVLSMGCVYGFF